MCFRTSATHSCNGLRPKSDNYMTNQRLRVPPTQATPGLCFHLFVCFFFFFLLLLFKWKPSKEGRPFYCLDSCNFAIWWISTIIATIRYLYLWTEVQTISPYTLQEEVLQFDEREGDIYVYLPLLNLLAFNYIRNLRKPKENPN